MKEENIIGIGAVVVFVLLAVWSHVKASDTLPPITIASYTITGMTMLSMLWWAIKDMQKAIKMPQAGVAGAFEQIGLL